MASKRKEKKAQKKEQQQKKPEPSKNNNLKTETKSQINEPEIAGYSTSPKGSVVHAVAQNKVAVCQSSSKTPTLLLEVNPDLNPLDCSCKHCLRRSIVKQAIDNFEEDKTKETKKEPVQKKETVEETKQPKEATKPKETKQLEETKKTTQEETIDYITIDQVRSMLNTRITFLEKRMQKRLEAYVLRVVERKPPFYAVYKGDDLYFIVHEPSRHMIVNNILEDECQELLEAYLRIKISWDGKEKMPGEWLTQVTNVYKEFRNNQPKLSVRRKKKQKQEKRLTIRRRSRR